MSEMTFDQSQLKHAMEFLYELRDYIDSRVAGERDAGQRHLGVLGSKLLDLIGSSSVTPRQAQNTEPGRSPPETEPSKAMETAAAIVKTFG